MYSFLSSFFSSAKLLKSKLLFQIHSCCCMYQLFTLFYYWLVFHCMNILYYVYPFTCWLIFVSSLGPLQIKLVKILVYKSLYGHLHSFFLGQYLGVEWVDHMWDTNLTFFFSHICFLSSALAESHKIWYVVFSVH